MLTRTRTIIACTAAAAAAGLAVGVAAPALATARPASSTVARPHGLRFSSNEPAIGRITSTRTFAGYETAVPAGSATVATTSFAVPTLTCTTAERVIAPSAAIPVNKNRNVSAAFVFVGCVNGAAVYYPGLVVNGTETDFQSSPFAAGDVIDLTAKVSTNRTRVQVTDVTSGVTQKIIGAGAKASDAFFGDEGYGSSSGKLLHVPDFGKLKFRDCLIDGKTLASWRPHAFQRVNSLGTVQIATGTLSTSGLAFATRFEHS